MPEERKYFTIDEVSALTGLTVHTLRAYLYCTDLVRGEDYYIQRFARFRRKTFWTQRGLARLRSRSYRVFRGHIKKSHIVTYEGLPGHYGGSSIEEQVARLTNTMRIVFTKYRESPCAVPNCPCMTHRLGLPQADEIARIMAEVREKRRIRDKESRG